MPVSSLAGASFTVSVGGQDRSAQITDGSIATSPTLERVRTLGPNVAYVSTDIESTSDVSFLYDEFSGFYKALDDAAQANTGLTCTIVGGSGTWTGTMYVSALSVDYAADGLSTCSASFQGSLTFQATD